MNLPISVVVPTEVGDEIPSGKEYLRTKLQQFIAEESIGEFAEDYSFLLFPKINILNQEVTGGGTNLIVVDLDVTLFVANARPNNAQGIKSIIFNAKTFRFKGAGRSKEKAFTNAFQNVNKQKKELQAFIKESRLKIFIYFKENCDAMIQEAEMLAKEANLSLNNAQDPESKAYGAEAKFASGINILKNLRIANTECFDSKTDKVDQILNMYDDFACSNYLSLARNQWAKRDLNRTIEYLDKIPPSKKCKQEMEEFLAQIESYVDDPDRNIENKIKLWRQAGGRDKAIIEAEAYKYLQTATMEVRRIDAQSISNRELLILK
ncbi:hypothetical protein DJ013_05745 [Arcticibacterium luteifluviistationis]|uniref:Uncharacterized protein n=2 Tax=Arcticibacterium luteifluviistationis TaxID=1784714 RepID=A0A2Z4G971_9BACT|nr:hypothetical protein DJ013_05745 [Arcticibacterium luteifluviistationis]